MKDFLYRILSTISFFQYRNKKILGVSSLYILMMISTVIVFGFGGYYGATDSFTDTNMILPAIPFIILGLLFVTNKLTMGKAVSKEVQDNYPHTQLARFRDPRYRLQRELYPNADEREKELEEIWLRDFGVSYTDASNNMPTLQRPQGAFIFVVAMVATAIGVLIGII